MIYRNLSYLKKLDALQGHFEQSTRLAEAIGVSRRTLLNWRDRPESIKPTHQLDIDVLYCKYVEIPEWDKPKQVFKPMLLPDSFTKKDELFMPFLRRLSYGTIEIESNISQADFDQVIDEQKLPRNMSKQAFHESLNTFLSHREIWKKIIEHGERIEINEQSIRDLHARFMRGVHENAGFFSSNIRVMGKLEDLLTTLPEDIPEEMNRWVFNHAKANTVETIARSHADFIAIHPFGDGNGRVGRALVMIQCLHARLMPPLFNKENQAMYYATMEHAMKHGRYIPLVRFFHEANKVR